MDYHDLGIQVSDRMFSYYAWGHGFSFQYWKEEEENEEISYAKGISTIAYQMYICVLPEWWDLWFNYTLNDMAIMTE